MSRNCTSPSVIDWLIRKVDELLDKDCGCQECKEQDNKIKKVFLDRQDTEQDVVDAINALPAFLIEEDELGIVFVQVNDIESKYWISKGKGVYGDNSGTTLTLSDIELIYEDVNQLLQLLETSLDPYFGTRLQPINPTDGFHVDLENNLHGGYSIGLDKTTIGTLGFGAFSVQDKNDPFNNGVSVGYFGDNYWIPYLRGQQFINWTQSLNLVGGTNASELSLRLGTTDNNLLTDAGTEEIARFKANREIVFPALTDALIDSAGDQSPITRSYFYNNLPSGSNSINIGNSQQIPYVNTNEDDLTYNSKLKWDNSFGGALVVDDLSNSSFPNKSLLNQSSLRFRNESSTGNNKQSVLSLAQGNDITYSASLGWNIVNGTFDNWFFEGLNNRLLQINNNGSLRINDSYTLPFVDGSSNQVLKTDGLGNVSWQDESLETSLNQEEVEDIVGGMIASSPQIGINVTYDDVNGELGFEVTALGDDTLSLSSTNVTNTNALLTHVGGMNDIDSTTNVTITIQDNATENIPVGSVITYNQISTGRAIVAYSGAASGDSGQTYKAGDVLTLWHKSLDNWVILNPPKALDSTTAGEPTGSDQVFNVVSLTQAEYDAGTPVATTLYNIIP